VVTTTAAALAVSCPALTHRLPRDRRSPPEAAWESPRLPQCPGARDELPRLVEVSRWDGVDFTPLEPDWQAGPVQLVEGVVVDLGEVGLGMVAFSPQAVQEIEAWTGQIGGAWQLKNKRKVNR
jgi:hypothetical protein